MSIGHPIPEIQLFQNLTLKIQGQGHGWGQSLKSQCENNILSTHILFVPCQSVIPFLTYIFFKIWPWKSKVRVMVEVKVWSHNVSITFYRLTSFSFHVNRPSHSWDTTFSNFDLENPRSRSWVRGKLKSQYGSNILSTHIPFIPCQSAIPFLIYNFFEIWPWKSKVKVRVEVKVGSHKVGVTSYQLTSFSFHVNRPFHSWDTAFPKFDLENPRSRSWVRGKLKSQYGSNILSTQIPFVPCQSAMPFLRYNFFEIWPWKSKVKVMDEVKVWSHNVSITFYQHTSFSFHVNKSSHSWDTMGKPIWGKWANDHSSAHLQA